MFLKYKAPFGKEFQLWGKHIRLSFPGSLIQHSSFSLVFGCFHSENNYNWFSGIMRFFFFIWALPFWPQITLECKNVFYNTKYLSKHIYLVDKSSYFGEPHLSILHEKKKNMIFQEIQFSWDENVNFVLFNIMQSIIWF